MGLSTRTANTTYLSIINGKITKKVKEGNPGAIPRVNKLGETVYELQFDSLSGKIKSLTTKDGDYGKSWVLIISDALEDYHVSIPFSGNYAYGLLRRLPNIDLAKDIEIKTGVYEEKAYLTIYQSGKKVEYYFTKEEPHDLPEMKKIKVKGKEQWDDTERLIYLENYVHDVITPKLKAIYELPEVAETPTENNATTSEPDDLPF